ncbi:hypothetical protein KPL74_04515 [Bacillus sp. NP157]|nr:hypothetical protein KPL74_04515 [Bacillus sp. NP157]
MVDTSIARTAHFFLFAFLLLVAPAAVAAVASPPSGVLLSQLRHTIFLPEQGAPAAVEVIAQAPDGLLWLCSGTGLVSFDGTTFDGTLTDRMTTPACRGLYIEPSGDIWVGHNFGGIERISHGVVEHVGTEGLPPGTAFDFARRQGVLWVATTHGLATLDDAGKWHRVGAAEGYPGGNPEGMMLDPSGTLWVADATQTWKLLPDGHRFELAGTMIVMDRIYAHLPPDSTRLGDGHDGEALVDSSGALWTATDNGLSRSVPLADGRSVTEEMTPKNGLSSDYVLFFLEDREHDIWVATHAGLERFQPTRFTRFPLPGHITDPTVLADGGQGLFVASIWQPPLHITPDGGWTHVTAHEASVMANEPSGATWFGGGPSLWRASEGKVTELGLPKELGDPRRLVDGLAPVTADDVWMSVRQKGLFRFHDGHWQAQAGLNGLPQDEPRSVRRVADHVWFGYADGALYRWSAADGVGHVRDLDGPVGTIASVSEAPSGLWVAGRKGVAWIVGQHVVSVVRQEGQAYSDATDVLVSKQGDVWITTSAGLYRIRAADVPKAASDGTVRVASDFVAPTDGPGDFTNGTNASDRIAESSDGRIWVATVEHLSYIDGGKLADLPPLPAPHITGLLADGVHYPVATTQLPPRVRDIRVGYAVTYLSHPDRVTFRYRLRGYDDRWQDVGSRREAVFTNLDDGNYTLEVQARLDGSEWRGAVGTLSFSIKPAYYQTWWFKVLAALVGVGIILALQWGWRRVTALEAHARVDERARVARDLHDNFLQSVQAFILRTHAAMISTLTPEQRQEMLKSAVILAENSMREGREKLGHLRLPTFPTDLADYLHVVAMDLAEEHPAVFDVETRGEPVSLVRPAFEQLQPICREALINAFRHAHASAIRVLVTFERRYLTVSVQDDGVGIEPAVLEHSRPGHWGLFGMRERAAALGARLRIETAPGAGTRVEVRVRARRIYSSRRQAVAEVVAGVPGSG